MPHRYLPRRPRALGHRGAMLTALGSIWVLIGLGLWITGDGGFWDGTYLGPWPTWLRSIIWVAGGLYAIVIAWRPITRINDRSAWLALYAGPGLRAGAALSGWVDHHLPLGGTGYERGITSFFIYGAICTVIFIASRWPEDAASMERIAAQLGLCEAQREARRARRKETA